MGIQGRLNIAFVVSSVLLAGCTQPHSPEGSNAPSNEGHHHQPLSPEVVDSDATDPFEVSADIIDGIALPGGDSLVLIVAVDQTEGSGPGARPSEMVLFMQRLGVSVPTRSSWDAALGNNSLRRESVLFDGTDMSLKSRGGIQDEGFELVGHFDPQPEGGFQAKFLNSLENRTRFKREISGVLTETMLVAQSHIQIHNWDVETWSVSNNEFDVFSIGIPTPTGPVSTPDGRWRSVTMNGPVRRRGWNLSDGRYESVELGEGARVGSTVLGGYSVGDLGDLKLTPDGMGRPLHQGTIRPNILSAILFQSRDDGLFLGGTFWWRHQPAAESKANEGSWAVYGRTAKAGSARGQILFTGEVELSANGNLSGHLSPVGGATVHEVSGEIKQFSPAVGRLEWKIPVTQAIDSAAQGDKAHSH